KISKAIYLFFAPGLILYSIFFLFPTVSALYYSFTDWDGISADFNFVGFENYERAMTGDSIFMKSVGNNFEFMFFVAIYLTLLAFVFAIFLVNYTLLIYFVLALFFFSSILSFVSVAFILSFVYVPYLGILNRLLSLLWLEFITLHWLGNGDI